MYIRIVSVLTNYIFIEDFGVEKMIHCLILFNQINFVFPLVYILCCNLDTGMSDLSPKWVRLSPNMKNSGLFKISKFWKSVLKVPNLSNFVPI